MSLFCVPTGVMGSLSSELNVRFGLRGAEPCHHDRVHLFDGCVGIFVCGRFNRGGSTWC